MPGIVAFHGDAVPQRMLRETCGSHARSRGWVFQLCHEDERVLLGLVLGWDADGDVARSDSRVVAMFGHPLRYDAGWKRIGAAQILELLENDRGQDVFACDGAFQMAVFDLENRRLSIITSPTGAPPLFEATWDRSHCWAPDGRMVLELLGKPATLDEQASFQFLSIGHTLRGGSLYSGVDRVAAGSVVTVDVETSSRSTRRYWDLSFATCSSRSPGDMETRLWGTIRRSGEAIRAIPATKEVVALTGGHDSRCVISVLPASDRCPRVAATWGQEDDVPGSDPVIARKVTRHYGVEHRFLRYAPEDLVANIGEWLRVSEGMNDNLGFIAGGQGLFGPVADHRSLVVTGDQIIGLGGWPRNTEEAVCNVLRIPQRGSTSLLGSIVQGRAYNQLEDNLWDEVMSILDESPSENPRDFQDYLFFHTHWPGWLLSPGSHREPIYRVFRPLMFREVIESFSQVPARERADKALFIRLLKKHLGEPGRWSVATAKSTIDWEFEILRQGPVRTLMQEATHPTRVEASILANYIDIDRFIAFREEFFSRTPKRESRGASRLVSSALAVRRGMTALRMPGRVIAGAGAIARKAVPVRFIRRYPMSAYKILSRVALVILMEEVSGEP